MNKKLSKLAAILLVAAMLCTALAACGSKSNTNAGTTPASTADQVTVSWYDGSKLLREDKVDKGSKLTEWAPEKENSTFMAWYSEASKTILFDFSTVINEDTDLFAGFKGAFVEDTTTWCLIGSGAGTLKASGWNESADVEETLKLTKLDSKTANLFEMKDVTLYEGDQFQIRVMGTWTNQHGVGFVEGYEELAAPDGDIVGEVKVNGERWFYANGGFGDSPKGWNVNVAKSGVYTLTLETNPGSSDYDVIRFERTGDAPEISITHEMYVKGTMNEWNATEDYQMTTDALREDFSFTLNITDEHTADWTATDENNPYKAQVAAMKVCNEINGTWYGVETQDGNATEWTLTAAGGNNLFLKPGQYNVKYNVASDTATVSVSEKGYFLAGVVDGGDHWDCTAVEHQFAKVDDTTYVVFYTFTEADTASWIKDAGKVGAVKGVYGFSGNAADLWFGQEADQENLMVDTYGLYRITLHLNGDDTGYVSAEKIEGNFLVGTLPAGEDWASAYTTPMDGDSIRMTWNEKAPASWLGDGEIAAIKVVNVDADGNVTWYGTASGDNVMLTETGTYTITLKDGAVTATK